MATWIIGILLLVMVLLICRYIRTKAKSGGCSGGCPGCAGHCHCQSPSHSARKPSKG